MSCSRSTDELSLPMHICRAISPFMLSSCTSNMFGNSTRLSNSRYQQGDHSSRCKMPSMVPLPRTLHRSSSNTNTNTNSSSSSAAWTRCPMLGVSPASLRGSRTQAWLPCMRHSSSSTLIHNNSISSSRAHNHPPVLPSKCGCYNGLMARQRMHQQLSLHSRLTRSR